MNIRIWLLTVRGFLLRLATYFGRLDTSWKVLAVILFIILSINMNALYKRRKVTKQYAVASVLLYTYLFLILVSTVFSRDAGDCYKYELSIFWSYKEWLQGNEDILWENLYNIIMFMPLGILLPIVLNQRFSNWIKIIMGILGAIIIELLQLILKRGVFEFDDIINNSVGFLLGLGMFSLAGKIKNSDKKKE